MSAPVNVERARESVEIAQYDREHVRVTVRSQQPGYLVLADSWYPGWNAYVDGVATPIYRADYMFRAVPVDAGDHTILFEFRPIIVVVGAGITVVSLGVLAAVVFAINRAK